MDNMIAESASLRLDAILEVACAAIRLNIRDLHVPFHRRRFECNTRQYLRRQRNQLAFTGEACPHFQKRRDRTNVVVVITKANLERRLFRMDLARLPIDHQCLIWLNLSDANRIGDYELVIVHWVGRGPESRDREGRKYAKLHDFPAHLSTSD